MFTFITASDHYPFVRAKGCTQFLDSLWHGGQFSVGKPNSTTDAKILHTTKQNRHSFAKRLTQRAFCQPKFLQNLYFARSGSERRRNKRAIFFRGCRRSKSFDRENHRRRISQETIIIRSSQNMYHTTFGCVNTLTVANENETFTQQPWRVHGHIRTQGHPTTSFGRYLFGGG